MNRPFLATVLAGTIVLVACGLDAVAIQEPDVAPSSNDDASTDTAEPSHDADVTPKDDDAATGPCTTTSTTCSAPLAQAGWTPVVVPVQPTTSCPVTYETIDRVTDPTPQPGACTCGEPDIVTEPRCDKDKSYVGQVGDTSCNQNAPALNVKNGDCTFLGGGNPAAAPYAPFGLYKPIQPAKDDVGECTVPTTKDETKLSTSPIRICKPPSACVEDTCNGQSTSEFQSCVVHDGDVACPAGFTNPRQAGKSAVLACSTCECTVEGKCDDARLEFFADGNCNQSIGKRKVNGKCEALTDASQASKGASSFKYTADPDFHAKLGAPSVATPTLSPQDLQTICCR